MTERRFNLTTTTSEVTFKLKSHFQIAHSIVTIKLWPITSRVSDWPITDHHMQKKTFQEQSSFYLQKFTFESKNLRKWHATCECFSFERYFQKKTFKCGFTINTSYLQMIFVGRYTAVGTHCGTANLEQWLKKPGQTVALTDCSEINGTTCISLIPSVT